jgi:hypothetical protein
LILLRVQRNNDNNLYVISQSDARHGQECFSEKQLQEEKAIENKSYYTCFRCSGRAGKSSEASCDGVAVHGPSR